MNEDIEVVGPAEGGFKFLCLRCQSTTDVNLKEVNPDDNFEFSVECGNCTSTYWIKFYC